MTANAYSLSNNSKRVDICFVITTCITHISHVAWTEYLNTVNKFM